MEEAGESAASAGEAVGAAGEAPRREDEADGGGEEQPVALPEVASVEKGAGESEDEGLTRPQEKAQCEAPETTSMPEGEAEEEGSTAQDANGEEEAERKQLEEEEAAAAGELEKRKEEEEAAKRRAEEKQEREEQEMAAQREGEDKRQQEEMTIRAEETRLRGEVEAEEGGPLKAPVVAQAATEQKRPEGKDPATAGQRAVEEHLPRLDDQPSGGTALQDIDSNAEAEPGWESDPAEATAEATAEAQRAEDHSTPGNAGRKAATVGVEALTSSAQLYLKTVFQTTLDRVTQATSLEPAPAPKGMDQPAAPASRPSTRPPEDAPRRSQVRGLGGGRLQHTGQQRPSSLSPATSETSDGAPLQRSPETAGREPDAQVPREGPHRRPQNSDNGSGDHTTDREPLLEPRVMEGSRLRVISTPGAAADARSETPLNRLLHQLFVFAHVQDRPTCAHLHTFVATCWHVAIAPAAEYTNANRTRVLLLLLLLWLAWGCAAPPEGRRVASLSAVGVCASIAVLNLLKEKLEILMDPSRGEAEGTPTSFTPTQNVIVRTIPAVAPALFLSFWAPIPAQTSPVTAPPLALAHALGSVAVMLLYAVPSYVLAHDEVADLPVACLWEWSGRSGFLGVALTVFAVLSWNGALGLLECWLLLAMFTGWALCQQRPDGVKRWAQQTITTAMASGRLDLTVLPALLWAGLQDGVRAAADIVRIAAHSASQGCFSLGTARQVTRGGSHFRKSDTDSSEVDLEVEGVAAVTVELCDKPRRPSSCTGLLMAPIELALYLTISSPNSRYPGLGLFFSGLWALTMTWLLTYSSLLACQELRLPISLFGLAVTSVYLNLPEWRHRERNARCGRAEDSITAAVNCCVLLLLFALPFGLVVRAVLLGRWGISTSPFLPSCAFALAVFAGLLAALPHAFPKRVPRWAARWLLLSYPLLVALAAVWLLTA
eukprot:GGOE01020660.1.p1 GENE.GGOE01020660.1~~GGOE01020660.1.p1  ORF type:complete len:1072 (-),score=264.35 GGOE01020660.1:124-2955(-)